MDVIQLLKKDHKKVKKMFEEYENLKGRTAHKKPDLVTQIAQALTIHTQVEEELVYPAFRGQRSLKEQVSEAFEEHHVTKLLLAELRDMQSNDEQYDAKVNVLHEYLLHHIKEEEKEMFPQAQKRFSAKHLMALGEEVEARQNTLMGEDEEDEEEQDIDESYLEEEDSEEEEGSEEEEEGSEEKSRKNQRGRQHAA